MGAFTLIVYSGHDSPYNIDFVRSFTNMKNRGMDQTTTHIENTVDISKINPDILKRQLSRDELRNYSQYTFVFQCHRNAINDTSYNASQPFEDPIQHRILTYPELVGRPKRMLMCNGEIYNYRELIEEHKFTDKDLQSNSDVEVILPMYIKNGLEKTLNELDGDYSFVLTENLNTLKTDQINIFVVRDKLGTRPLYFIKHNSQIFYMFTSELKSIPEHVLNSHNYTITEIPPGCYWSFKKPHEFIRYHSFSKYKDIENCVYKDAKPQILDTIYNKIQEMTNNVIIKRIKDVKKIGVLLSGGLDSSIIMSFICKYISTLKIDSEQMVTYEIHAFTLGKNYNSHNIELSKELVQFLEEKYNIDIYHHVLSLSDIPFSIKSIDDIIYKLESFEPEIIRDSIPYYFLMKYISTQTNIKILITGDGLDEFCGYSEFNNLNDQDFQEKSIQLLQNLNKFDLLRIDKIAESFGLEVRFPFLDESFIDLMLSIHPKLKKSQQRNINEPPLEKYLIRKSFEHGYVPQNILWQRFKCFCEYCDVFENVIQEFFNEYYTDIDFANFRNTLIKDQKNERTLPKSKEEMYYRHVFTKLFPNTESILPFFWKDLWEHV
jgi:asparagine synthase (glutamine-hydrolysing)